jgi:hypothetical protein
MAKQMKIMGHPTPRTKRIHGKVYKLYIGDDYNYVFVVSVADGLIKSIKAAGGDAFRYLVYKDTINFFVVYYRKKK